MNPEERKLMIEMGKALKAQGEIIADLQKIKGSPVFTPEVKIPMSLISPPALTSTVDHESKDRNFKMNVRFSGQDANTQEERMNKSVRFLRELEEVFDSYGITHLSGTYDRLTHSPISS